MWRTDPVLGTSVLRLVDLWGNDPYLQSTKLEGLDNFLIEATLSTLEDALSQNDLLPLYRHILATRRSH